MKKLGVFVAAALLMASTTLFSQPMDNKRHDKLIDELKLSDEQKKDYEKIHVDMQKQEIAQKAKNETARVELQQILKADTPDKSAIEKKINEIASLIVQLHMIKVNSWFAVNKLLNPEQQKTWKKVLEHGLELQQHRMMRQIRERHMPAPHSDAPVPK